MKRVFRAVPILVLVLTMALAGCAASAPQSVEVVRQMPVEVMVEKEVAVSKSAAASPMAPSVDGYDISDQDAVAERMIIRTGNLSLVVADTEQAVAGIEAIVASLKGYVVDSRSWRTGEQTRANMTIRVPAGSFEAARDLIKELATVVNQDAASGEDVTEEYADLDAQLRNLEAAEEELRELLTQVRERTGKAEDILAVYRELTNIRGQIERIKGRTQYLERMTALATIYVDLEPDIVDKPVTQTGWRPGATLASALGQLVSSLQWLADALIWIVLYVLPIGILVLLPLAVLLFLVSRWRRSRARKSAS